MGTSSVDVSMHSEKAGQAISSHGLGHLLRSHVLQERFSSLFKNNNFSAPRLLRRMMLYIS